MKVVNFTEGKWGSFFTAPVGSHPAIIVWVAELGTAMSNFWKDDREQDLIRIFFEIEANVNTAKEWEEDKFEDKVFLTEQNYTCVVANKSKLWKMIAGVYGRQASEIKGFSLDKLLWVKCVINVTHNDKWYSSIESVSKETTKMKYHDQVKESFYFWINEKEWDEEIFESFAPFVKDRILQSNEAKALGFVPESLDEQEEALQKEIKDKKITTKEAENIFNDNEANWKAFVNEKATAEDDPFTK
jgi:hypothetical protein